MLLLECRWGPGQKHCGCPELTAEIEASTGKLAQLKEDVKSHQTDRAAAKEAMAEATSLRDKEKAAFDSEKSESETNIAGIAKATAAIEKGMGGSFLQTTTASLLKKVGMARNPGCRSGGCYTSC